MRRSFLPLSVLALVLAPACLDLQLQKLEAGVCGNGVVDQTIENGVVTGEDCDGPTGVEFVCRPADVAWPCSFSCTEGRCPTGYGCGVDGVCRLPVPTFDPRTFAHGPSQAQELYAGDFDADGRKDILGVEPGRARVHFASDTEVLQQVSIPSLARPSIGRLGAVAIPKGYEGATLDLTDDLVLPLNIGVGALISTGDRAFTPKTYGSITFGEIPFPLGKDPEPGMPPDMKAVLCKVVKAAPMAFEAVPGDNNAGDETVALLGVEPTDGTKTTYGFFASFSAGGSGLLFRVEDTPPDQLAGPPVVADFDKDKCEEVVFPRRAPKDAAAFSTLSVYKACVHTPKGYDWMRYGNGVDPILTVIDAGGFIVGPAFVHDVNGDGNEDLLITVSEMAPEDVSHPELRVAYSLGNGQFDSQDPALGPVVGDNKAGILAVLDGLPLAVGEINGDGRPDVVTGTHVFLGIQGVGPDEPLAFAAVYQSSRLWSEAHITNLNGDGFVDVVACTDGAPDIDILTGNGMLLPNPSKISTDGTVGNLTVGDFDGDLIQDLAFQDTLTSSSSLLMVSYGRTSGGPEDPRQIGDFTDIQAIATGSVLTLGADSISDLGVVSRISGDLSLSFFPGAGNRVTQTPYLLTVTGEKDPAENNKVHVPYQTAIGFLRPWPGTDEALNDVAILAINPPDIRPEDTDLEQAKKYLSAFRLWGLFGAGEGTFEAQQTAHCKMPDGSFSIPSLRLATSILVPDVPVGQAGPTWVAIPHVALPKKAGEGVVISTLVARAHFDETAVCSVDEPHFSSAGEMLLRARTADLNGNGIPEIVAIQSTFSPGYLEGLIQQSNGPGDDSFLGAETAALVVFWDGALGEGETLTPYMPDGQPELVNDFTIGDIDGDGKPEVLVVGAGPAASYSLGDDGRSFKAGPPLDLDLGDARAVLLADADGDGVKDLAVASGSQLQLYKGASKPAVTLATASSRP